MSILGFAEMSGDTERKYSYMDYLSAQDWDFLRLGINVKSLLTGVSGVISELEERTGRIRVSWDNGNESYSKKYDYHKVVLI